MDTVQIIRMNYSDIEKLAPITLECSSNIETNLNVLNDPSLGINGYQSCLTCPILTEDSIRSPAELKQQELFVLKPSQICPGHSSKILLKHKIVHPLMIQILKQKLETFNTTAKCQFNIRTHCFDFVNTKKNSEIKSLSIEEIEEKHLLSDPEIFILKYIVIIPPMIRASIDQRQDDVTNMYARIMMEVSKEGMTKNLYRQRVFHLYEILLKSKSSFLPSMKKNSLLKNPNKLLLQRISGKDGFFRKYALGKRLNFSARSVITPDVSINVDEVAIPSSFCNYLCVFENSKYRPLKDGDYVMINRQPTLQKTSILFLKAIIQKNQYSIGLNPITVVPLNGDFDGDEVSVYSIVFPESIDEVEDHLLLEYHCKCIGLDQNTIVTLYSLSKEGEQQEVLYPSVPLNEIVTTLYSATLKKYLKNGNPERNSKFAISSLFPDDFNYDKYGIVIVNGIFIKGVITKGNYWTLPQSVLKIFHQTYGNKAYMKHIREAQLISVRWVKLYGLTIGLKECIWDKNAVSEKVTFEDILNKNIKIETELQSVHELESREEFSGLLQIVQSGSKGDLNNIGQIMSCVGQQEVKYVLPHISIFVDPYSRGFCLSSYTKGLDPIELFYHAQNGREGIIRTAITTSITGYGQRTLVRFLEDLTLDDDNVVRNSNEGIVQF